ncbi:MAG: hypothetical protein KDD60_06695 [Bdellovibrionales bacterium]|nr:hypothetical protein [Bdellovibrionales bacterium]
MSQLQGLPSRLARGNGIPYPVANMSPYSNQPLSYSSPDKLLGCLESVSGIRALVIGDVVLDRYIWGKANRISPEAPVPIVHIQRTEDRLGCAGNAARNLRELGVEVALCGILGEDDEGRTVERLLGSEGISHELIFVDQSLPTIVKTRVIAQSQQVVRIDREEFDPHSESRMTHFHSLLQPHLGSRDLIIVSDYGKGTVTPALFDLLQRERDAGNLTCPVVVDPHPANFGAYHDITIAKPNRGEAELASGIRITDRRSAIKAASVLRERWSSEMMMITLGEDGLVIVTDEHPEGMFLETAAQEVFDVSGAGDTVTAVFSAAYVSGKSVRIAGELANLAAGIVVSEVGTVPIELQRLEDFIRTALGDGKSARKEP